MRINSPSRFMKGGICTGNESFFLYYCLPWDSKKGKGRKKKFSGIKGNKRTWLRYYIPDEFVPRISTGRCHGYGQKHQQIPSWILPDGCSIWNPLAWRYPLQRERWRGFWRDVGVGLSSPGLRLRGNKWLERWRTPKRKLFHRLPEVEDREK